MTSSVDLSSPDVALAATDPQDLSAPVRAWLDQIREARERRVCLRVRGAGSKDHLGDLGRGEVLDTQSWQGIVAYEPSELVLTARAGTPLAEVEAALASQGQFLAFEPPRGRASPSGSTLGGVVAAGLSGPSRASRGAVRDHVLGVRMLNGRAQSLRFGGSVMKNVAGFDLSRLMAGSMGTLGVLTEVTLKVLPQPVATVTLRFELSQERGIALINQWAGQPVPLDASAWWDELLVVRLRGAQAAVASAGQRLMQEAGGQEVPPELAQTFWDGLRDQQDEFFERARGLVHSGRVAGATLWRLSVPATAKPIPVPGETLIEWFGAQRWLCTAAPAAVVHEAAARAGGHAVAWVSTVPPAVVLPPVLLRLHRQVQRAFDPDGVFDTGRLWPRAGA
ncbi:MAG TPA: glycolate oxidase subunit GlcE [Aquabacterium sp.]|uniref:glycolate oxidase subunit GlcE n=1 Tax=Aquabacterium sp. TaxID=1872578 RepID=UPI002E37AA69|nr:glycolate oxidase subunit GlcE [Aquabacterium sp.]HEX5373763.1 glycolate oxidase subunit GlcE [Aquabacterium sp.]